MFDRGGLPALPADCWRQIFGNDCPVAVEIGPGRGEFLLASAQATPARNFYAIERSAARTRAVAAKIARNGIANALVLWGDAGCIIDLLPEACVAAFHIQFPDPWWKRRHHRRRLWTPHFVAALCRTLVPDGTVEFMTDVADYFAIAQTCLDGEAGLERLTISASADVQTSFARKAQRRGALIARSVHRRRP